MALTQTQVSQLYVAIFNRASEGEGNTFWQGSDTAAAAADQMLATSDAAAYFGASLDDNQAFIEHIYLNTFNKTVADDADGIAFWVAALATQSRGAVVAGIVEAATSLENAGTAQDQFNNRVAVSNYAADNLATAPADYATSLSFDGGLAVTEDAATVGSANLIIDGLAAPVVPPAVEGETIYLTSSTDRGGIYDGTDDNDTFLAYMEQNPFVGGVSNSLSSADKLDGGAGADTLHAELVDEFTGTDASDDIDVQPRTAGIEKVTLEARDEDGRITLDAKHMTGLDEIGSQFSDGDLIIENLTTLTDAGVARNTESLTITMDHTDNFNSDNDASDLTVYFDEDYLLAGQTNAATQANYWMLDEDSTDYLIEPLLNIERDGFKLKIDGIEYTIQMESDVAEAADTWPAFAAGIAQVIANSANPAFAGLSVIVDDTNVETTFNDDGVEVTIPAISIIDSQGRLLEATGFTSPEDATGNFDIFGRFDSLPPSSTLNPITINVDVDKVGREGEGGDLLIGGKELDRDGGTVDQGNGIPVFNLDVLGGAARLSNLGDIDSTNGAMTTLNIATHADYIAGDDYASLTIRDGVGRTAEDMDTINANAFLGDLFIGEDRSQINTDTFTATGGGDVTYDADINGNERGVFTNTTGEGDDTFTISLDGDAVDTAATAFSVNAGNGNNDVTVSMAGAGVSVATTALLDNLDIITGSGDDFITLIGGTSIGSPVFDGDSDFNISAGGGDDTVDIDASLGTDLGNWDISAATGPADWIDRVLYQAELTVDFAGFTQTVAIVTNSAGDFISTQTDINNAIKDAIDTNSELARLLTYSDGTAIQQLNIVSVFEGVNDLTISVFQPELIASGAAAVGSQVNLAASDNLPMQRGLVATTPNDSDATDTEAELLTIMNAMDQNLNETGVAIVNDFLLDSADGDDGNNDVNVTNLSTIDMGTGAHDLLSLASHVNSSNTVEFSAAWGKVSILNFFETQTNTTGALTAINHVDEIVGDHILDFTFWLDDENSTSGSALSAVRDVTNLAADSSATIDVDVNTVNVINDFAGTLTETWAALSATDIDNAFTGALAADDYASIDASGTTTTVTVDAGALLGTSIDSILMIENDLNDGEYKVFNVETTDVNAAGEAFTVTLVGTIDFGESLVTGLAVANFA